MDARHISEKTLGKNFPNTPMLAATAAVTGVMSKEEFLKEMEQSFAHKFAKKPEVIRGNMEALEMAYDRVEKEMRRDSGSIAETPAKRMKQSA